MEFVEPAAKQGAREWTVWRFNDKSGLTLKGYSRSTDATFFHVKELGMGLDAGGSQGRRPPFVFLTHGHTDHSNSLPYMAGLPEGITIYAPEEIIGHLEAFIRATKEMNNFSGSGNGHYTPRHTLVGVMPGQVIDPCLGPRHSQWSARVFKCTHAVPCVGYAFQTTVSRLRADLVGLEGSVIKGLRKQGVTVTEPHVVPRFAYVGDTSIVVFADNPWLLDFPIIILECTFLEECHADRCARDGHITWPQLEPYVRQNRQVTFVLIHFSLRYSAAEIKAFFGAIKTDYPNVVVNVGHQAHAD